MNIKAFKLVTGEDILGDVINTSETFTIENPVGISIVRGPDGNPNVGFSPFPLHSEDKTGKTIDIHTQHVVYFYEPAEDFIKNYEHIFGSGLILPPKNKTLITG